MSNNFFRAGSFYRICDVCGHKYHAEETLKRWDNLIVCKGCWEPRHPQDFLRAREDRQAVPDARPRPTDVYIPINWTHLEDEIVPLRESISKLNDFGKSNGDTASLTESYLLSFVKNITETISVSESNAKEYTQIQSENISLIELDSELKTHGVSESISVSESTVKAISPPYSESIGVTEDITIFMLQNLSINQKAINSSTLG